jgi:thioredoxin reductase
MKGLTVDLVVTGDQSAAVAAAVDAVRRGQRVLVVLRSGRARVAPRLRRLRQDAKGHLTVMTNAEVVCVDGVGGVEAVVMRYTRTGRLCAVNTSAFLSCDGSTHPPPARMGDMPLENRRIEPERGDILETAERRQAEVEVLKRDSGPRGRDLGGTRRERKLLS